MKERNDEGPALAPRPAWAKAVIVAELVEDRSDCQTDYFNHTTTRTVPLAWSRHTRDLFPEMRKAAARFGPTAHLGPGLGLFRVVVVLASDCVPDGRGCAYWSGCRSPWHHDEARSFQSRADAEWYIRGRAAPNPLHVENATATFAWRIEEEEVEHREKWSMGGGYYLKSGTRDTDGWRVRKRWLTA